MTNSSSAPELSSSASVTISAPAKINLILRILDRRTDGFHNLWSLMQTVGLEDDITISLNRNHADIRLTCDDRSLSADQGNLVYRAAAAVLQRSRKAVGLDIALNKRIPVGAGLGGGSSDAAATIIGVNRLLGLGWSAVEMAQVGQELGSDVPFFFFAPSAFVAGKGERVHATRITGSRWIVLVNPGFPIETKWAYQQLSSTRREVRPLSAPHSGLAQEETVAWERILGVMENDFEIPVFQAHPGLRTIRQRLLAEGAEAALLSGSGATVFGVFDDEARARGAVARLQADSQLKLYAVPVCSGPLLCRPGSPSPERFG